VVIFGGDPAGLAAALEQAEAGMKVTLIEPSPSLGGGRISQTRILSEGSPAQDPNIEAVRRHPNIRVLTNAQIEKVRRDNGAVSSG